jgi:antitoxin Phd
MDEIQLKDAKASLSAVVDRAVAGKPSVITRHGRREAVLISWTEWERLRKIPPLGRLLMAAPIEPGDLADRRRRPHRSEKL